MLVAVIIALVMVASLSCKRQVPPPRHTEDAHFIALDSALQLVRNVDSLMARVDAYHQAGDEMGELLACKYSGKLLRDRSRFADAIKYHSRGLDVATQVNDTLEMVAALNNVAADYLRFADLSNANDFFFKALKLCDQYGDPNDPEAISGRVRALNGIGNIEMDLCNYSEADSVLRDALEGELYLGNDVGVAVNYSNLGVIKRAIGEIDSAWMYYRKSMEYNQRCGGRLGVAVCHLRYGELHEDERRFSHALEEYHLAHDSLKALDDHWHLLDACLAICRVSLRLDEREEAMDHLLEAEAEAVRIGSLGHQSEAHMIHHELALMEGDAQSALQHFAAGKELHDSIYGLKKNDELRLQYLDYERSRAMGEMDVLNKDITRLRHMRNIMAWLIGALLLMAGGIIGLLVYIMRVRSRTQQTMRQVEETRSLFFTNVVHQLRTPLTAIMTAIDGIIADARTTDNGVDTYTADQRRNVEIIERQGNHLLLLVDRILEVGGVRSAIKKLDWRTGDAVAFIHMVVESYRENCLDKQIELSYVPREKEVIVDLVPKYLNTIVGSLIENAICYSREFGKITVNTCLEGDLFVIKVADSGMGISSEDLAHVFEPFYRGAAAERMVEGVGIGLTVVRDMTMALGGTVTAESVVEQGSVFIVKLPCHYAPGVKEQLELAVEPVRSLMNRHNSETEDEAPEQRRGLPKVLIIEDHSDVAHLIGSVLGAGYEVHYADDGEQGLNKANELIPDLIITDVKMPIMDGCELCRRVRATRRLCHIPVIMLSARNSSQDRIRGIEAGADVYMVKPFAAPELRSWAVKLLESRELLRGIYSNCLSTEGGMKAVAGDDMADSEFLARFDELVLEQIAPGVTRVDLDKVARAFRMGEGQLKRKVQELSGKNVVAYVISLRMEKAKRLLLEQPDTLIGSVAEQCGFTDVAYFSRVFRRYYKKTPSQVRNGASGG